MLENEKPDIVLKTAKRFNIKITPNFIISIPEKSLKLEIVFLVMLNIMLISFYYRLLLSIWAGILNPSLSISAHF